MPHIDIVPREDAPKTPLGCLYYFAGFCVFVLLLLGLTKWLG